VGFRLGRRLLLGIRLLGIRLLGIRLQESRPPSQAQAQVRFLPGVYPI